MKLFKQFFTVVIPFILFALLSACGGVTDSDEDETNGIPSEELDGISNYQISVSVTADGQAVDLVFGQIDGASNSYDPGIDLESPPAPPGEVLHAWFVNDGRPLMKDFRDRNAAQVIWTFNIDHAGHEELRIEWSAEITELPGRLSLTYSEGLIVDDLTEESVVILTPAELDGLQIEYLVD
ncbi:MAG: hypothetical protein EA391_01150 [Balneolaceae bacterium]|nr:MAG: hypothetical protein EA391_01150 [Balneolaceae bacterium]